MKDKKSKSIFERQISPWFQAAVVTGGFVVFSLLGVIAAKTGLTKEDPYLVWSIAASTLLLFAIFNCILSLPYEKQARYWLYSILAYLAVALVGVFTAQLVSGIGIGEAKSFKWIYFIFTFGYLVLLAIVRAMRKIVRIAQKQDQRLRGGD